MNPEEFFTTCDLLLKHNEEPHFRTVVGRSYYATFLYFRDFLKEHGLEKTKKPRNAVHDFVLRCLQYSEVTEANCASEMLSDLRQKRHDADYNLEIEVTQNDAEDAFGLGKNILKNFTLSINAELTSLLIEKATVHAKAKDWLL